MRTTWALFLLTLAVAGCGSQSATLSWGEEEARALVERFLAAEFAGNYLSEDTRIYGCEQDYQPSTDDVEPIGRSSILDAARMGDTLTVHVEYHVLGRGHLGDRSSFTAGERRDTVPFRVVEDTLGTLRIYCGPHPANHWGPRAVEAFLNSFDEPSRKEWAQAIESFRN